VYRFRGTNKSAPVLGEAQVGSTLVRREPALLDRAVDAGAVLCWRGVVLVGKRPVDPLHQQEAVHIGLEPVGDLDQSRAATSGSG